MKPRRARKTRTAVVSRRSPMIPIHTSTRSGPTTSTIHGGSCPATTPPSENLSQAPRRPPMKRLATLAAVLFLLISAVPVLALDKNDPSDRSDRSDRARRVNVIDDVVRMAQAGVSDDAIISYVVHTRERFEVTADDVIALNNAHVSKEVIK